MLRVPLLELESPSKQNGQRVLDSATVATEPSFVIPVTFCPGVAVAVPAARSTLMSPIEPSTPSPFRKA